MKIRSFDGEKAILYLVATPIGNLEDMTFRAVSVLKSVDKIYAEDTRTSKVLLSRFDIHTPLASYHEFSQETKEDKILEELQSGMKVALISDAGLPIISDPGFKIVQKAIEHQIAVSPIPGASAGISALIASGLSPSPYLFCGFLDAKQTKRIQQLTKLKSIPYTLIFYEAPHRVKETLEDIRTVLGNRKMVVGRELTKSFEEFVRGTVEEVQRELSCKGEMVLLVEGCAEENLSLNQATERIDELIALGYSMSDAVREVCEMFGIRKNEVYRSYLQIHHKE